jgi:hypothetical protein
MGVSKGVAEWFIQLDDGGLSFIDTPLYANTSNLHLHKDMLKEKKHMCGAKNIEELSFEAERGIRQGTSASSLRWTLLYDMILEWIDPKNRKLHENEDLQEYSDQTAINAAPYAYADNPVTCSAGPEAEYVQQLQATWLSAFCAFSGLTIHPGKIKATIVGKIDPKHELKTKPDGTKYISPRSFVIALTMQEL